MGKTFVTGGRSHEVLASGLSNDFVTTQASEGIMKFLAWRGDIPEDSATPEQIALTGKVLGLLLESESGLSPFSQGGPISLGTDSLIQELGHRIGVASDLHRDAIVEAIPEEDLIKQTVLDVADYDTGVIDG